MGWFPTRENVAIWKKIPRECRKFRILVLNSIEIGGNRAKTDFHVENGRIGIYVIHEKSIIPILLIPFLFTVKDKVVPERDEDHIGTRNGGRSLKLTDQFGSRGGNVFISYRL